MSEYLIINIISYFNIFPVYKKKEKKWWVEKIVAEMTEKVTTWSYADKN